MSDDEKMPTDAELDAALPDTGTEGIKDTTEGGDEDAEGNTDSGKTSEPAGSNPPADDGEEEGEATNDDRSRLGRKVANVERQLAEMNASLNRFFMPKMASTADVAIKTDDTTEEDDDYDSPMTRRDVKTFMEQETAKKEAATQTYFKNYVKSVYDIGTNEKDTALYGEVIKELDNVAKYPQQTGDAQIDARLNYLSARNTILEHKLRITPKTTPLDKNTRKDAGPPASYGGGNTNRQTSAKMPKLDADAQNYLDYMRSSGGPQLSDDEVIKILTAK